MSEQTVDEMVEKAQSQETFSFSEVVLGRGYPKDEVAIYLDEATAHEITKLEKRIGDEQDDDKIKSLNTELVALHAKLAASRYVFKVTGIPSDLREDLLEKARNDVPSIFQSNKNFMTGQVEKIELENPKRDRLYTNLLWQATVEQIVAPTGAVDTAPDLDTIVAFRNKAPMSQLRKFNDAVEKLVVVAEAFEASTDDDFLANA